MPPNKKLRLSLKPKEPGLLVKKRYLFKGVAGLLRQTQLGMKDFEDPEARVRAETLSLLSAAKS